MQTIWKVIGVFAFFVISTFVMTSMPARADTASCIKGALTAVKSAGSNQRALKRAFNDYLGEPFAAHAARKKWARFSMNQRRNQVDYARKMVASVGSKLAKYADSEIVIKSESGNKVNAIAVTADGNVKVTAFLAGSCQFLDIKVEGYPSLAEMVGDHTKHLAKNDP